MCSQGRDGVLCVWGIDPDGYLTRCVTEPSSVQLQNALLECGRSKKFPTSCFLCRDPFHVLEIGTYNFCRMDVIVQVCPAAFLITLAVFLCMLQFL